MPETIGDYGYDLAHAAAEMPSPSVPGVPRDAGPRRWWFCRSADPGAKGLVERAHDYLERSFLPRTRDTPELTATAGARRASRDSSVRERSIDHALDPVPRMHCQVVARGHPVRPEIIRRPGRAVIDFGEVELAIDGHHGRATGTASALASTVSPRLIVGGRFGGTLRGSGWRMSGGLHWVSPCP